MQAHANKNRKTDEKRYCQGPSFFFTEHEIVKYLLVNVVVFHLNKDFTYVSTHT